MDILEKVVETEMLGRDFLVWIWFKSEINGGIIDLKDGEQAEIHFDGKITLQSEGDESVEKVVCTGINARLREARFALSEYKKVTEASIKLVIGDEEWFFALDSAWMNFKSFKTPKVEQDDDDPDGLFYEKIGLLETAVKQVDAIYEAYIKLRVSDEWKERELPAIRRWVAEMTRKTGKDIQ